MLYTNTQLNDVVTKLSNAFPVQLVPAAHPHFDLPGFYTESQTNRKHENVGEASREDGYSPVPACAKTAAKFRGCLNFLCHMRKDVTAL